MVTRVIIGRAWNSTPGATASNKNGHMDFLRLKDKWIVVAGVANRRSVAWAISRVLTEAGAKVIHVVKDRGVAESTEKLTGGAPVVTCNVENTDEVTSLGDRISEHTPEIHGFVHSIAFANYAPEATAFTDVSKPDFLQAMDISCYSLIGMAGSLRPLLAPGASVVTISISTTTMAADNYGYMGPVKAALNSTVAFLAKDLSKTKDIRVNAVGAGPLKTSSSAAIPGYVESYLYAEQVIPRGENLRTEEVANVAAFLLSERSSGINAQTVAVDAGMGINYFDTTLIKKVVS